MMSILMIPSTVPVGHPGWVVPGRVASDRGCREYLRAALTTATATATLLSTPPSEATRPAHTRPGPEIPRG